MIVLTEGAVPRGGQRLTRAQREPTAHYTSESEAECK